MENRVLNFDFESLPNTPFSIYFIEDGEVSPKMMFTVLRKAIDLDEKVIKLFIYELNLSVVYDPSTIVRVELMSVN